MRLDKEKIVNNKPKCTLDLNIFRG